MYSTIFKNAKIYDGIANEPFMGDVAIEGDKIVNIAEKINSSAENVHDLQGLTLTPGFIDLQNHSDSYWQIFDNPKFDSLITQGFTTLLIGNCGASLAPLLSNDALYSIQKWHSLEGANINWQTFDEYIKELSKHKFACNIASLVGYSTLRRGIIGDQIRPLEKDELPAIKNALIQSLNSGAFGLSSGLSYSHEIIISELELFEMAKILKEKQVLFSVHLRSESSEIVESIDEVLDIARATDVEIKISHLKIRGENNWPKFEEVISKLDTAYYQGLKIHFDAYPYTSIWQVLYSYLPKWAIEGGRRTMLEHFSNPVQKNKILSYLNNSVVNFQQMYIASSGNRLNFVGKTIGQIAKNMGCSSEQAVLNIIENGGSEVLVFDHNLKPEQVQKIINHPLSFVATDGGGFSASIKNRLVHPRCFGTSAKFLKQAVESSPENISSAIKKLSSGPAKKIKLKNRGEIKIGNFGDLVVLNESKINDLATYENPYQFSQGIEHVFVNGKAAVFNGKLTENLDGYVLKKT